MRAVAGGRLHRGADLRDGGHAVLGLDHDLGALAPAQAESGAGPRASPRRSRTAAAAASAAPGVGEEHTTRMSVEKGG